MNCYLCEEPLTSDDYKEDKVECFSTTYHWHKKCENNYDEYAIKLRSDDAISRTT